MTGRIKRAAQAVKRSSKRHPKKFTFFGISGAIVLLFMVNYIISVSTNLVASAISPFFGLAN